ncbi:transcription like protein nupm1 [Novymonas esmeraldas]|uniref:Transcription like protein nupm1 n=1 Tax=Novymonas esmeraldas TaxID=1808958 RepID=A0AAW0EVA2_9TRYP
MTISTASIVLICICSAVAAGFGAVLAVFLLMWFGFCRSGSRNLAEGNRRRQRRERNAAGQQGSSSSSGDAAAAERERKGIPLNSRPPRLTPEQEMLRDRAMEKYKRRQARQQRRRERQEARESRVAKTREENEEDEPCDDGSSVTSRTTLTSAATTVRTSSTVAYGHGAYLLLPPGGGAAHEDDEEDDGCRSAHSGGSRRSSGTARSRASQGTVATIKSYLRHRQRQRLRRREEQQHVELFNQWAHAQMASSSELSPSSKSSVLSSHEDEEASAGGAAAPRTHAGARTRGRDRVCRRRSASVASSAPRPPEEVLGGDHVSYPFLAGGERGHHEVSRAEQQYTTPDEILVRVDERGRGTSPSPPLARTSAEGTGTSPRMSAGPPDHGEYASHRGSGVGAGEHADPLQPRRHKRTWKDVEHSVALSGFFNSPANNSMAGVDLPSPSLVQRHGEVPPSRYPRPLGEATPSFVEHHEPIGRE